jgi:hypothetical protein
MAVISAIWRWVVILLLADLVRLFSARHSDSYLVARRFGFLVATG